MKEQAGILAQNLREAEPCPVCGSLTHPHPASLAENAVSEAAVKAAKEQREQAETARDTAYQEFDRQKSAAAEQELRLEQAKQQFLALAGDACGDGEKELYTFAAQQMCIRDSNGCPHFLTAGMASRAVSARRPNHIIAAIYFSI